MYVKGAFCDLSYVCVQMMCFSATMSRSFSPINVMYLATRLTCACLYACLFGQLPPVCHHHVEPTEFCQPCHLTSSDYWPADDHVFELPESERHRLDPVLSSTLDVVRKDVPSQALLDACFNDFPGMIVDQADVVGLCHHDTTILCSNRAPVARYNEDILKQLYLPQACIPTPMVHNVPESAEKDLRTWLDNEHFHDMSCVAVGARVLMLVNADLFMGAVNGALGVVSNVVYATGECASDGVLAEGVVKHIIVRVSHTDELYQCSRSHVEYHYHDGICYRKSTFPLSLAYAMTGHKAQGATLSSSVIVHVTDAFCPGLMYVILSRVTQRSLLKIVGRVTVDMFNPVKVVLRRDALRSL